MTNRALIVFTACIVAAGAYGSARDNYFIYVLTLAAFFAIAAVGLDLLVGYTGYLSIAHGALLGVGAYTFALLTVRSGWNFWLAFAASGVVSGLIGAAVGIVAFRAKGLYFAVLTLGIGLLGYDTFTLAQSLTGGYNGFVGVPSPADVPLLHWHVATPRGTLYFALVLLWLAVLVCKRFVASRFGAWCLAIREDELLAQSLGVRTARARMAAFVVSSAIVGFAGAFFATLSNYIGPDQFSVTGIPFQLIVLVTVGGMGTIWGPVLGALVLTGAPELLRVASVYSGLAFGIVLLVIIRLFPGGIAGILQSGFDLARSLRRKPAGARL
jgi:branched-chain amino acid transport system permease protein